MLEGSYVIIGRDNCPYCDMAKTTLNDHGGVYHYFNTQEHPEFRDFLIAMGFKTVPQVWRNGKYLGGFHELSAHIELIKG